MKHLILTTLFIGLSFFGLTQNKDWTIYNTSNSGIGGNDIYKTLQVNDGTIYTATNKGLCKFDVVNWYKYDSISFSLLIQKQNSDILLSSSKFDSLLHTGLYTFDGVAVKKVDSYLDDYLVTGGAICETKKGEIYASIYNSKDGYVIAYFNGTSWSTYNKWNSVYNSKNTGIISSIIEAKNGDIYFAAQNSLLKFDGKVWTVLPHKLWKLTQLSTGEIYGLNNTSLVRFDGENWTPFTLPNSNLPNEYIVDVLATKTGKLYVASESKIVEFDGNNFNPLFNGKTPLDSVLDPNNFYYNWSNLDSLAAYYEKMGNDTFWNNYTYNNISSITEAVNGDLLIGTSATGLFVYHGMPKGSGTKLDKQISGIVYKDANKNGKQDFSEIGLARQKVKLHPQNRTTYTNANGEFSFPVESGTYNIEIIPTANFTTTNTITDPIVIDTLPVDTLTFPVTTEHDTTIITHQVTLPFPFSIRCHEHFYTFLDYKNAGTTLENIHISLQKSPNKFLYSYPYPDSISVTDGTLFWHKSLVAPNQGGQIQIQLAGPGPKYIGDTLPMITSITNGDSSFAVIDTFNYVLKCAYDPNDKQVSPAGVYDKNYTLMNEKLSYMVRFQNTGNDTAHNIIIRDTLSPALDVSTFEFEASSHGVEVYFDDAGAVAFNFKNIFLPDSGTNNIGSNGFVKYSIRPKKPLAENTKVANKAYIYFDYNEPIITNEVYNTYVTKIPCPTANNSQVTTPKNDSVVINLLKTINTDPTQPPYTINITQPTNGVAILDGTNINYTPTPNFFGADTLTYSVCYAPTACATGIITILVEDACYFGEISGKVLSDTSLVFSGEVTLYTTGGAFVKSVKIDKGEYLFKNVLTGGYKVKASGVINNVNLIPQYNSNSFVWNTVKGVDVNCKTLLNLNFNLPQQPILAGTGSISGYVENGQQVKQAGIPILLAFKTAPTIPVAYTTTNVDGNYEFNNLPTSKSYVVIADNVGSLSESKEVLLDEQHTNAEINFCMRAGKIANCVTVGINELEENTTKVTVVPNPFTTTTTITFNNTNQETFSFTVVDFAGKVISQQNQITESTIYFDRNNLETGMYFFKIQSNTSNKLYTGKLIVL